MRQNVIKRRVFVNRHSISMRRIAQEHLTIKLKNKERHLATHKLNVRRNLANLNKICYKSLKRLRESERVLLISLKNLISNHLIIKWMNLKRGFSKLKEIRVTQESKGHKEILDHKDHEDQKEMPEQRHGMI